uniref:Isoleucine--tRNA ligase n=1 Tax=Meloidogyne javanica TaxID=6303 RepID=A0A915M0H9_MELJA
MTIPLNNAIAVHPDIEYAAIESPEETRKTATRKIFIVAKDLISNISKLLKKDFQLVGTIKGEELARNRRYFYKNAMYNDLAQEIIAADFVTANMGTGLVHLSYAHGHDDYKIGSQRDVIECFVDERGRYTRHMGYDFEGKEVLGEGTRAALEKLKKDVLFEYEYTHSYPYDWRYNKPVIIRSCPQWFMDVSSLNKRCEEAVYSYPGINVSAGNVDLRAAFSTFFTRRNEWCISRQRAWGVPIPAITRQEMIGDFEEVKTTGEFIRSYAQLVKSKANTDLWWTLTLEELSRLKDSTPFKQILIHGMAVDDKGSKMSKSKGNVVLPEAITDGTLASDPVGADGLRYWAAWMGAESAGEVRIGPSMVRDLQSRLKGIRLILRFILGTMETAQKLNLNYNEFGGNTKNGSMDIPQLQTIDRYILARLNDFSKLIRSRYNDYRFGKLMEEYFQFTQKDASSYITSVRDRLYCEPINSTSHQSVLFTLNKLGYTLVRLIAPILPHLAAEFFTYHPQFNTNVASAFRGVFDVEEEKSQLNEAIGDKEDLYILMRIVQELRNEAVDLINKGEHPKLKTRLIKEVSIRHFGLLISGNAEQLSPLQKVFREGELYSEIVELFGASFVRLSENNSLNLNIQLLDPFAEGLDWCGRCRKINNQIERKEKNLEKILQNKKEEEKENATFKLNLNCSPQLCEKCEYANHIILARQEEENKTMQIEKKEQTVPISEECRQHKHL